MIPAKISSSDVVYKYVVNVGDKHYKVVRHVWQHWEGHTVEDWSVYSPIGTHWAAHYCDDTKPTFKRVVAATKAALDCRIAKQQEGKAA